jgi:LacI family transcriptional regulator
MANNRATLADVANATGLSVATVSKVLNDHADVAPGTRLKVQQQLRESAYRATGNGRRRSGLEGTVEVESPGLENAYVVSVLNGVIEAARGEHLDVAIGPTVRDNTATFDPHALRRSGRVGAVFITVDAAAPSVATLIEDGFPTVVVDPVRTGAWPGSCVSIGATNFSGGLAATSHLLALGHRRIAHAAGPKTFDCSQARMAGYLSALAEAGLPADDDLIVSSQFDYAGGRASGARLLDLPERPTAIFAAGDEIALGILEEARRRAVRVPEDLSIVGFDDTYLASRSAPPLTTMAQPLAEMGRLAVRTLSQLINGTFLGTSHLELATHLVLRESTAPWSPGNA